VLFRLVVSDAGIFVLRPNESIGKASYISPHDYSEDCCSHCCAGRVTNKSVTF